MKSDCKPVLNGLLPDELSELLASFGLRHFRAQQVMDWLYKMHSRRFQDMTNLSKRDRAHLDDVAGIGSLRIRRRRCASDNTQKWLIGLEDGNSIETVIIPEAGHWTQCISTQVGCAMGCSFCATSRMGLIRQLHTWEIVDQVSVARRNFHEGRILSLVLMGMGEPLANYDAVVRAIRLLLHPECLDFSKRRITLSTCGLIPAMERLAKEGLGINLAVSLNASTDEMRSHLMPINRTNPLHALLDTFRHFPLAPRNRITFEYVLISDLNDSPADSRRIVRLLKGIRCKINLIPHNAFPGSPFRPPSGESIRRFQRTLVDAGFAAPVRWSRGNDISAACGQLISEGSAS